MTITFSLLCLYSFLSLLLILMPVITLPPLPFFLFCASFFCSSPALHAPYWKVQISCWLVVAHRDTYLSLYVKTASAQGNITYFILFIWLFFRYSSLKKKIKTAFIIDNACVLVIVIDVASILHPEDHATLLEMVFQILLLFLEPEKALDLWDTYSGATQ